MPLRDDIADYYFVHWQELTPDKQFHFAQRLLAWNGDGRSRPILHELRRHLVPQPLNDERLAALFQRLLQELPAHTIPAYTMRRAYFAAYPRLFGIHQALLRLRHLQAVYGIDARTAFTRVISLEALAHLEQALLQDTPALRILSTYAINTLYLYHLLLLEDDTSGVAVTALYRAAQTGYDLSDPEQLRLFLYFYTHCVIAASNFYIRRLPAGSVSVYQNMLKNLEAHIEKQFSNVSLDTKLEFWVCCHVAGYKPSVAKQIEDECQTSLSPKGPFIIDTQNVFSALQTRKDFVTSEHRNTLFIMSGREFSPHSTLL